jgi:hypothetical protein
MKRAARRTQGSFSLAAVRRREIERHARHVGAADTEDFWRWPTAWAWHNQNTRDPVGALMGATQRMGATLTEADALAILEQADGMPQHRTADSLARFLGVTYPQRQRLGITTIGSVDVSRRARRLMRKRARRLYWERRRRSRGARPRTEYVESSLMRIEPWKAEGISRRTWYRRKRGTTSQPPIPTLTNGPNGTSPQPAIYPSGGCAPVPTERKQGASGMAGGGWEGGLFLTGRWIAARERACGCRHNRLLPADLCPAGRGQGCGASC